MTPEICTEHATGTFDETITHRYVIMTSELAFARSRRHDQHPNLYARDACAEHALSKEWAADRD